MELLNQEQLNPPARGRTKIANRVLKVTKEGCGRILIVEDEVEQVEILEFNLLRQGFDVLVAEDGLEACRIIGREKPDLILLDILLPLLDGWEICRMVRSHHETAVARTPIIVMSALGAIDERVKGYALGADLYLPKPYMVKEVMTNAHRLVKHHRYFLKLTGKVASLQKWAELQDHWQQALFHELRNQLTVISGMAQHLHRPSDLPHDRSEEFAKQISNSSHYLGTLAENYLLVRQVEDHPEQLLSEPTLLGDLLSELKQLFVPLSKGKSCRVEIDCPENLLVNLHPLGLKIILSSLLDNALKYSPEGELVSLTVTESKSQLLLLLKDSGPGIAEQDRGKVFEKFFRGANQKSAGGSGLGLYMARTLTEAMGGTLGLLDNPTSGCCFQLSFPLPS